MCFPANDTGGKAFCEATAAPTAVPQALQPTMAPTDGPPDAVLDDGTQLWSVPDEGEISFSNSISRSWEGGAKVPPPLREMTSNSETLFTIDRISQL